MTDPFSNGGGSNTGLAAFENCNVLIIPREYLETVKTANGDKDAIDADVVNLDADGGPELEEGVRIFGMVLIGALKRQAKFNEAYPAGDPTTNLPKMTLGRLIKDEENKKKGQNAPWKLQAVEDEAVKNVARAYIKEHLTAQDPFAAA